MRLCSAIPGWEIEPATHRTRHVIGVLPGEGIGPEVVEAAVTVLRAVETHSPHSFDFRFGGAIGTEALETRGTALTEEVASFAGAVFDDEGALLCGAGGSRFVYDLRARFDLFCKLTPVRPMPALHETGVVRAPAGADLVVVRENRGGMYFGEWRRDGDRAEHTFGYDAGEVRRILDVGVRLALRRRGRLALVLKPEGLPAVSGLWQEIFDDVRAEHGLDTSLLEVDHAAYQLIAASGDFDVVVAPNLFGDILSDCAALLLGSRGLSFSGNFGAPGRSVFQTGHGAARDLAGKGVANPIGQILSAAMMLREAYGLHEEAQAVEEAVDLVLGEGIRTRDIAGEDATLVGTREMGQRVAQAVDRGVARGSVAS